MDRYVFRRILVVVLVFTLVIFSFSWLMRKILNRPNSNKLIGPKATLVDYSTTANEVKFVAAGNIVGNEAYREVRITISKNSRVLETVDGYENTITSRSIFPNNQDAYRTFLAALQNAGFTQSRIFKPSTIPQGACPQGKRYWYQILEGTDFKQSLWNSSCSSAQGTFAGKTGTVSWLFTNQIPEYDKLVKNVRL